jgi:rhomboid protease GluP
MSISSTPPPTESAEELPYPSCQVPTQARGEQDGTSAQELQPRRWKPTATWVILGLNVLVWALDSVISMVLMSLWHKPVPPLLLQLGAKHNELILQGEVWRLVTPIFLHVGLLHIAFNAYAIYMIGPQIECFFGPYRFLSIYLLSGIYGVFLSFALSTEPSAGASGAIFGLIGTQAAFFYRYRDAFGKRGRRQLYSTLSIIAFNLVLTFSASNIDIWGHIGGLLTGAILGWSLMPDYVLVDAEVGQQLIDRNHPRKWGRTVLGAICVLITSTLLTVIVQTVGLL